jgi:peptide/nickel transport system permease protein
VTRYVAQRLVLTIPVLFLVSIIVFTLINLIPGDPALLMAGGEAGRDVVEALRRQMGLDRPMVVRYAIWLGRVVQGDLGKSVRDGRPVLDVLRLKLPVTTPRLPSPWPVCRSPTSGWGSCSSTCSR